MYCPKCSQQQISEEMRFCSRCGFSLGAVRELVASENALVEKGAGAQTGERSCGQKAVRRGAWIMLAALLLTIFVGFLTAVDDDFAVLLLVPFFCFVFGVLNVFYGVFLADKRAQKKAAALKAHAVPMMPVQQGFPAELPAARIAAIESFPEARANCRDGSAAQRDGEHYEIAGRRLRPAPRISKSMTPRVWPSRRWQGIEPHETNAVSRHQYHFHCSTPALTIACNRSGCLAIFKTRNQSRRYRSSANNCLRQSRASDFVHGHFSDVLRRRRSLTNAEPVLR